MKTMYKKLNPLKFLSAVQWNRLLDVVYKQPRLIPVHLEKKRGLIMKSKNDFLF